MRVATGLERIVGDRGGSLRGQRVGLICNPTAVDAVLRHAADLISALPDVELAVLFGPEHGVRGDAQDMIGVDTPPDARTGVRVCYHTHSGNYLGANGAALRLLFQDLDPHHVGAFVDTGHVAINGCPIRLELDMVRPWLSLVAIKDMAWERGKQGWRHEVVLAGEGIVRWDEVAQGLNADSHRTMARTSSGFIRWRRAAVWIRSP